MRIMIIMTALFLVLPLAAQAQTIQQIFRNFGLIGIWARNCDQPADADTDNWRTIYALSGRDGVMLTYDNGPKYRPSIYSVVSAERKGADRLVYVEERFNSIVRATVTVQKFGDQIGVMSSVLEDGKALVEDGKFTADGRVNPRQSRCPSGAGALSRAPRRVAPMPIMAR
jgi:hypothetical protein